MATDTITESNNALTSSTISQVGEQTSPEVSGNDLKANLMSFAPIVLIFLVFYFMLIRPQMKKQKEHLSLLDSLKKGEKVIAGGGIVGVVSKIEDEQGIITMEIAPDIKIKVLKSSISVIMSRDIETDKKK
jgi:preprotein translocase subunit YajC